MAIEQIRQSHYNATVTAIRRVHEDLLVMRILHDGGPVRFSPGQYTSLGLGSWEPTVDGIPGGTPSSDKPSLVRRAYSFSAAMVDDLGQLLTPDRQPDNEFFVALVVPTADQPLSLTPRLFALQPGDRMHMGHHAHGNYTLSSVGETDTVVFCATGTGEAPHNTMVAHLLGRGHRGRIVSITCVRYRRDLAYLAAHESLQRQFASYQYIVLTTREPENLDRSHPGFVGKRHLQQFFLSGDFERETGIAPAGEPVHVFLCGNPAMIGVPTKSPDAGNRYPEPMGMVEVLEKRGLVVDLPRAPGNIHFEKYW